MITREVKFEISIFLDFVSGYHIIFNIQYIFIYYSPSIFYQ